MSKLIPLNDGYNAIVDDEDYSRLSAYKWIVQFDKRRNIAYAIRRTPRKEIRNGASHFTFMHRDILWLKKTPPFVDHANGNTLDNRKSNLRICTNGQNQANTTSRGGTSRFKGVHLRNGRWISQIRGNNKKIYLGSFKTERDAAMAYDHEAKKLFGEFAHLNLNALDAFEKEQK